MSDPKLQCLREANLLFKEPCSSLDCGSVCCEKCFDLDVVGLRRQYCNGDYCERSKSPRWPSGDKALSPSLPVLETGGPSLPEVKAFGLVKLDLPPPKKAFVEECHRFTGQEGFVKKEYKKVLPKEFPRKPWQCFGS
jgi:hypothetical protein